MVKKERMNSVRLNKPHETAEFIIYLLPGDHMI